MTENEIEQLRADLDEARTWARHGYEIGQKSCLWSDYGVAPEWLTEGWPLHFDAEPDELNRLRAAIERVRQLHVPDKYDECAACTNPDDEWPALGIEHPCRTLLALTESTNMNPA